MTVTLPRPDPVGMGPRRAAPVNAASGASDERGRGPASGGTTSSGPASGGDALKNDSAIGRGNAPARGDTPSRGDLVSLAIQMDAMIARSEELGLGMTTYLLNVARADLGERLGERRVQESNNRPSGNREHRQARSP